VVSAPFSRDYWKHDFFKRSVAVRITDRSSSATSAANSIRVLLPHPLRHAGDEATGAPRNTDGADAQFTPIQPPGRDDLQTRPRTDGGPVSSCRHRPAPLPRLRPLHATRDHGPLDLIIESSRRIESGDLSEPEPIMADDETGGTGTPPPAHVGSVRAMVKQIGDAARSIDQGAGEIAKRTRRCPRLKLGTQRWARKPPAWARALTPMQCQLQCKNNRSRSSQHVHIHAPTPSTPWPLRRTEFRLHHPDERHQR